MPGKIYLVRLVIAAILAIGPFFLFESKVGVADSEQYENNGLQDVKVVDFERLGSNHVRVEWSNGVVFSGTLGTEVTMGAHTSSDGAETKGWIRVKPPEISGAEQMQQRAEEYRNSNRSLESDFSQLPSDGVEKRDATDTIDLQSSGTIWDSGCTSTSPTDPVYVYGCYTRYVTSDSDPNNYYSADKSQVTGNTNGSNHYLSMLRTDHWYSPQSTVVSWSPAQDNSVGNCTQRTFGLTGYGVQMSETINVCPDRVSPSVFGSRFFVDWEGQASSSSTRASTAMNHVRTPVGYGDSFVHALDWGSYYCTGFC